MTKFSTAVKQHKTVRDAADRDLLGAQALWYATMGEGEPELDSYVEAAHDLAPPDHGSLLAKGGFANAFALGCLWMHWDAAKDADAHERRELARAGWAKFEERARKAADVEYGLGFDQSMSWECTRDFDTSVCRGMATIEEIAKLAGRMFAQLKRDRSQQVCSVPEEVYSVELGSNVSRLLPSELAHLGEPTEIQLLDNLANGKALQYALRGTEDAGRGPLVICLDESGSMHNQRGVWAKAATVAMVRIAWEDDRTCVVVHWSYGCTVRPLQPGDHAGLLEVIRHWLGGGNVCELALSNAADQVEALQKQGDKGADVVLVTDGVETMTSRHEKAIDRIQARGARLWTVGIEVPIAPDVCIRARAERYTHIDCGDMYAGAVGGMKGAVI